MELLHQKRVKWAGTRASEEVLASLRVRPQRGLLANLGETANWIDLLLLGGVDTKGKK